MSVQAVADHRFDVVIVGGGLAGQALARHLLLETDKSVLLLEKRTELPQKRQKVGESSVQVAGYYYSRVLDLEEYLFRAHFMKYNLRFYWKSAGRDNSRFEDYGASYIRPFSNLPSYQLDRNEFEGELLRRNQEDDRFTVALGATKLEIDLVEDGSDDRHVVRFEHDGNARRVEAGWVVDTSGRAKFLARRRGLRKPNPIRHGSFFWWVDGLVDIDKLTDASSRDIRMKPARRQTGHLPSWLATNHFCDEGLWFWVIPLQGKTSLGLVFDKAVINHRDVFTVEKATRWVCERFPCFARDLPNREVLDFGGLADFSYDCEQTIDPGRWALAGEAGRFSDPLYSPGSDLIAIYNTLIVDAIQTDDRAELGAKCALYEQLMRSVYAAYEPTYATSYDALGDQEVFSLKYTWELTIYFAFYVFPFINDLFTDRRFDLAFLKAFGRLGPMNKRIQQYLSDYYQWKCKHRAPRDEPAFFDFMSLGPLATAEKTFYRVGADVTEAREVLRAQLANVEELGRFVGAWITSVVLDEPGAVTNASFVASLDPNQLRFDPAAMAEAYAPHAGCDEAYRWSFDPAVMEPLRTTAAPALRAVSG